eukprot:tig00020878_g14858.t2
MIKLPAGLSLSYRLAGQYWDANTKIFGEPFPNPLVKVVLVQTKCPPNATNEASGYNGAALVVRRNLLEIDERIVNAASSNTGARSLKTTAGSVADAVEQMKQTSPLSKIQTAFSTINALSPPEESFKGLVPYFSVKALRVSSYFLEVGWLFPAFSMLDVDVVGYMATISALDPQDLKKVLKQWIQYIPGSPVLVTDAVYSQANKLTVASLARTANGTRTANNMTVDPSVCEGMKLILVWDTSLNRGHCRKIEGNFTTNPGTFLAGSSRTSEMQNMFSVRIEDLNPGSPYKINVLAVRMNKNVSIITTETAIPTNVCVY